MREYPLPDTDDHNQPTMHTGLKDIARFIEDHSIEFEGQVRNLVGKSQHIDAVLKPFDTGNQAINQQWQASEEALTRVVNAYLKGSHAIDVMPGKTYSRPIAEGSSTTKGSAAIAANESTLLRGLRDSMKNPALNLQENFALKNKVETDIAAQLSGLSEMQR